MPFLARGEPVLAARKAVEQALGLPLAGARTERTSAAQFPHGEYSFASMAVMSEWDALTLSHTVPYGHTLPYVSVGDQALWRVRQGRGSRAAHSRRTTLQPTTTGGTLASITRETTSSGDQTEEFALTIGTGMQRVPSGAGTEFDADTAERLRNRLDELDAVRTRGEVESCSVHLEGPTPR